MKKKLLTSKGLKYLTYGSLLFLLAGILSFTAWNLLYHYITNTYLSSNMGWAALHSLLYVAGGITFLLGIYVLWKGRKEFGSEHTTNVEWGLWVIIIFLSAAAFISGPLGINEWPVFFIQNLMILVVPLLLIKSLIDQNSKIMLWTAISAFVILYPLWAILIFEINLQYYDIYPILFLSRTIPYALLSICYYRTYIDVKKEN